MPRLGHTLIIKLLFPASMLACGGSTGSETAATGGAAATGGTGGGGSTSTSCNVINTAAAQVQLCEAAAICAQAENTAELAECMGADYARGSYVGAACSDYANCVKTCNCEASCSGNCIMSTPCSDCLGTTLLYGIIQSNCAAVYYTQCL